ncbi:sulfatase [Dyadobacter tibetensis]|uniref:sulfatase n=1 Tax=Dyadobacter tibetensis TaxID=1211851 RepID=UPI000471A0AB|nr:sulfatase [Dyadobacter tibetensis]
MKICLKWTALSLGILLAACSSAKKNAVSQKPNILFILVDDLGWADIGAYGSSFYETPNIDALAGKGMKFTSAYAACPVCSPTRASILTGKYPARTSTTDWFGAPQPETVQKHWTRDKPLLPASYNEQMALEEETLAEAFKAGGYRTFFAGKWHLGHEGFYPEDQGFEINKGGYWSGSPRGNHYFAPYANPKLPDGPANENLTNRLADETIAFIEGNKDKPFLAYLSFYSVHTPLGAPQNLIDKYTQKKARLGLEDRWGTQGDNKVRLSQSLPVYGAMVESMDMAVGKVMNALKEKNLDQNTVIVFMSDNGGLSTSEGHPTSNLPLKAGKGWLYEGGVREPMLIYWPGVTKPGSVTDQYVVSTDFYPTLLEMAGLPLKPEQHQDGKSMVPLLKGKKLDRGAVFWHYPHYGNQGGSPGSSVRLGDWKLIQWFEEGRGIELYNLKEDLGENNNLAQANPEKVRELQILLDNWRKETQARYPSKNPNAKPL